MRIGKGVDRPPLAPGQSVPTDRLSRAGGRHDAVVHRAGRVLERLDVVDESRTGLERVLECLQRVAELLGGDAQLMDGRGIRGPRIDLVREDRAERVPDQTGSAGRHSVLLRIRPVSRIVALAAARHQPLRAPESAAEAPPIELGLQAPGAGRALGPPRVAERLDVLRVEVAGKVRCRPVEFLEQDVEVTHGSQAPSHALQFVFDRVAPFPGRLLAVELDRRAEPSRGRTQIVDLVDAGVTLRSPWRACERGTRDGSPCPCRRPAKRGPRAP